MGRARWFTAPDVESGSALTPVETTRVKGTNFLPIEIDEHGEERKWRFSCLVCRRDVPISVKNMEKLFLDIGVDDWARCTKVLRL